MMGFFAFSIHIIHTAIKWTLEYIDSTSCCWSVGGVKLNSKKAGPFVLMDRAQVYGLKDRKER